MADSSKIDKEKLKEMALTGASPQELLDELDISNGMVLSSALLDLLRSEEKIDQEEEKGVVKHYTMNPIYGEEGILITPDMLKDTEFKDGDEFGLTTESDRIILDKSSVGSVGPL